jgi:hypothetical protein
VRERFARQQRNRRLQVRGCRLEHDVRLAGELCLLELLPHAMRGESAQRADVHRKSNCSSDKTRARANIEKTQHRARTSCALLLARSNSVITPASSSATFASLARPSASSCKCARTASASDGASNSVHTTRQRSQIAKRESQQVALCRRQLGLRGTDERSHQRTQRLPRARERNELTLSKFEKWRALGNTTHTILPPRRECTAAAATTLICALLRPDR